MNKKEVLGILNKKLQDDKEYLIRIVSDIDGDILKIMVKVEP